MRAAARLDCPRFPAKVELGALRPPSGRRGGDEAGVHPRTARRPGLAPASCVDGQDQGLTEGRTPDGGSSSFARPAAAGGAPETAGSTQGAVGSSLAGRKGRLWPHLPSKAGLGGEDHGHVATHTAAQPSTSRATAKGRAAGDDRRTAPKAFEDSGPNLQEHDRDRDGRCGPVRAHLSGTHEVGTIPCPDQSDVPTAAGKRGRPTRRRWTGTGCRSDGPSPATTQSGTRWAAGQNSLARGASRNVPALTTRHDCLSEALQCILSGPEIPSIRPARVIDDGLRPAPRTT